MSTSHAASDPVDAAWQGSMRAMDRAARVLARGAASSARIRTASPSLVMARADGALLVDVDGNEYVDHMLGLGPVILGHRPPEVLDAVRRALGRGLSYGAQHEAEADLCERIVAAVPCAEMALLVSTGSEGVQLAARVARARTGRQRIVKFDGHYHGWSEPLFANVPGMAPIERSPAAPTHAVAGQQAPSDVTVVRWGSLAELERGLADGPPAAAVFMEPVPCNFGTVLPDPAYIRGVRELCTRHGAMLVFDEVLTGFRLALGGAQERIGVTPDLAIFSKAIASGLPLAAVVGSADAMAPAVQGPIRAAGTFNGSPLSVAAGVATLSQLSARRDEIYPRFDRLGATLAVAIRVAAAQAGAPLVVNQVGSVVQLFWGVEAPVNTYEHASGDDRRRVAELAARLLAHGVHAPERGLLLLCDAHTEEQLDRTAQAFAVALREVTAAAPRSKPTSQGASR